MRKIVAYKLLTTQTERLTESVTELIAQGWEPLGQAFVEITHSGRLGQCVVKYEELHEASATSQVHYIVENSWADLHASVNRHIAENWQIHGQLSVLQQDDGLLLVQPVSK